jgi:hypothetical protein
MSGLCQLQELFLKIKRRILQTCTEIVTHRSFSIPPELKNLSKIDDAIDTIQKRWPTITTTEPEQKGPLFIFSAGWRSGSTLLQRLICSSGEIVVWGEPLCDAAIIPRMAQSLSLLSNDWPPDSYLANNIQLESFSESWIANVTPPIESLWHAHRAFYEQWLGKPAKDIYGISQWGVKEVHLTIQHARYLKWVFPHARFIFIYRNLTDAYLSWRGNTWASRWPGYYSWSPIAYARHWKLLLDGYLDNHKEVNGYLIKYEELIAGEVNLEKLSRYIGIKEIDSSVLNMRIASPDGKIHQRRRRHITRIEKLLLRMTAGKLMRKAGYS